MSKRPQILITNDDGISAPGIRHLWQVLHHIADLTIVAPFNEQSGTGLGITLRSPLRIEQVEWPENTKAFSVNGTPADCVKMALSIIVDKQPDLIVAGINRGSNAGRNVLYSGTVAGVIEGIMHDIPGIAFSCYDYFDTQYDFAKGHIPSVVNYILENPLPLGSLLNVNFPPLKTLDPKQSHQIKGFKLTRQGKEYWKELPDKRLHPAEGSSYYWLGSELASFTEEDDCDISWLKKGYMTAVPIHVAELTDHLHLEKHRHPFEKLYNTNGS